MERLRPVPQEIYRHFKDKLYQIVTIAKHSETGEELVVYQALYGDFKVCARPLDMFMSEVDHEKYPEVKQKYRFEKVDRNHETEVKEETKPDVSRLQEKIEKPETKDSELEEAQENEEETVNPDLLAFLDAETYEEKRNLLVSIRTRITDRLIDDIAMSLDIEVKQGDLSDRYNELLQCVDTMKRFEVERLH